MKKLALIVLAGASLLGTGIASAQYSFGDEGYWQRRGREYGLPCDNTRWCAQYSGGSCAMDFLSELWLFMRVRKKYWLMPIFLMTVVLGGLVVLSKGSAVAPFIYTLF